MDVYISQIIYSYNEESNEIFFSFIHDIALLINL